MSRERQRARERREVERSARAAEARRTEERRRRRDRRRGAAQGRLDRLSRARRSRPYGRRSLPEKATIAGLWLFLQFVFWQFVDEGALRVAFALATLLALPAAVVLISNRRNAPS